MKEVKLQDLHGILSEKSTLNPLKSCYFIWEGSYSRMRTHARSLPGGIFQPRASESILNPHEWKTKSLYFDSSSDNSSCTHA